MVLLHPLLSKQLIRRYSSHNVATILKQPFILSSKDVFKDSIKDNAIYQYLNQLIQSERIQFVPDPIKVGKKVVPLHNYDTYLSSPETLPLTIRLKNQEDMSKVPRWRRLPTLGYRVGKKLLTMYRESIQTTWRVWRQYKSIDTKEVLRELELGNLENKFPELSRKQFVQNVIRVSEIRKLPKFILCLFIFEELTFLLIYLRPQFGLYRCLGNGAFNKLSKKYSRNETLLMSLLKDNSKKEQELYKTVYSLSTNAKVDLLRNLIINKQPHWKLKLWKWFHQDDKLSNEVNKLLQYLIIDDWLILKRVIGHTMTKTTPIIIPYNELVNCILERQLYKSGEDLNHMVNNPEDRQVLIQRLLCYWSFKFNGINIEDGSIDFTNKWGVNNIMLLNYTGTVKHESDISPGLINREHLGYFKQ